MARTNWIYARVTRLAAVDLGSALLGTALLVVLRFVPQLLSPLAFGLLLAGLLASVGADLLVWLLRGIRAVSLDGDSLFLLEGMRHRIRRLDHRQLSRIRVRRRWGGGRIEVTVSGRRRPMVIGDDAFAPADFERMASLLEAWI